MSQFLTERQEEMLASIPSRLKQARNLLRQQSHELVVQCIGELRHEFSNAFASAHIAAQFIGSFKPSFDEICEALPEPWQRKAQQHLTFRG